jgi:predicted ester cyclase
VVLLRSGLLAAVNTAGKQVTVPGVTITRIANSKIAENWSNYDMLGMVQQLGVVPTMG